MLSLVSLCAIVLATVPRALADLSDSSLKTYLDTLDLGSAFNPVTPAYWTNFRHHMRTPFSLSPDGMVAYLAYLDASGTDIHVQAVDPATFASKATPVTVKGGKEAGGLVAQNDGFALLTNIKYTGAGQAPPDETPVPIVVRYKGGAEAWRSWVGGPPAGELAQVDGRGASPFIAGDLVWSEKAKLYGTYFAQTDYAGSGNGHYGDSHMYLDDSGQLKWINGASNHWGCSHNMGIGFEAADEPPFASVCADDHTGIWLNTKTLGMSGPKIANENATQFSVGEPMGGYGGSYSVLARFPGTTTHLFAWRTRGAINLELNEFMEYAKHNDCGSYQRTPNGNVAVAVLRDKATLVGPSAIAQPGARDGDAQVQLVTTGATIDHSNVRIEAFDGSSAMLSWEQIDAPACDKPSYGCKGAFAGTYFQQVDAAGAKVGAPIKRDDVFVSGDLVRMPDGRLCWPYVNGLDWDLSVPINPRAPNATVTTMSFACMTLAGAANGTAAAPPPTNGTSAFAQEPPSLTSSSTSTYTPMASPPPASNQQPPTGNRRRPGRNQRASVQNI